MAGSQDYAPDPRNRAVQVWLNGALMPRDEAKVSIFDAGFCMGDGIWEGAAAAQGRPALPRRAPRSAGGRRRRHRARHRPGSRRARARPRRDARGQRHDRRCPRPPDGHPRAQGDAEPGSAQPIGPATIAIVAEHKRPPSRQRPAASPSPASPSAARRPSMFDMRLNSHSRLNLIIALQQAIRAGADEALMLDPRGFVSSCNATNFFIVARRRGADLARRLLLQRRHARPCDRSLPRERSIPIRLADFAPRRRRSPPTRPSSPAPWAGSPPSVGSTASDLPPLPGRITRRLSDLYEALKDAEAAKHGA